MTLPNKQSAKKFIGLTNKVAVGTMPGTGAYEYIESLLGDSKNFEALYALLQGFLSVHTEDSGCWVSWLHVNEAIVYVNQRDNCSISKPSFYRMVDKLKKTGLLVEVLHHTWANKPYLEGQCAVFLIDPVLVTLIEDSATVVEPSTKTEAIELAKRSARRTKSNPNKVLSEYSLHDRAEVEEKNHFEREAELAAEEAQEYSDYCYDLDYHTWLLNEQEAAENEAAENEVAENGDSVAVTVDYSVTRSGALSICTAVQPMVSLRDVAISGTKLALIPLPPHEPLQQAG